MNYQVDQTANQKHHYDEHHLIIQGMVQDYSVHHDQAIRNLTNELSNEIHLSKNKHIFVHTFCQWVLPRD